MKIVSFFSALSTITMLVAVQVFVVDPEKPTQYTSDVGQFVVSILLLTTISLLAALYMMVASSDAD